MPKEKYLSEIEAAPLTSREIAKVIAGTLGGLASWCDPEEIRAALKYLAKSQDEYVNVYKSIHTLTTGRKK